LTFLLEDEFTLVTIVLVLSTSAIFTSLLTVSFPSVPGKGGKMKDEK